MFSKLSVGLWSLDSSHYWGSGSDSTAARIERASHVEGLSGVEVIYPTQVNEKNFKEVRSVCDATGLSIASVNPNVWSDPDFSKGAFTSQSSATRQKAIDYGKAAYDMAREFGADYMCLWPGQDGLDYPFQENYPDLWDREAEGIGQVARYAKGHRIGIEYKLREPRGRILLDSASTVLLFSRQLECPNVGVHLDFGHALLAKENPAESVVKCSREGKLFGLHLNDNYGATDEDMLPFSIHHYETAEFVHALQKVGYDRWFSFEFNSRGEDPFEACALSIRNLRRMEGAIGRIDEPALRAAQARHEVLASLELINEALFR